METNRKLIGNEGIVMNIFNTITAYSDMSSDESTPQSTRFRVVIQYLYLFFILSLALVIGGGYVDKVSGCCRITYRYA